MNTTSEYRMQADAALTLEVTRDIRRLLHDVVSVLEELVDEIKTPKVEPSEVWQPKPVDLISASRVIGTVVNEVERLRVENVELKAEIYALWRTDHEMEFGGEA